MSSTNLDKAIIMGFKNGDCSAFEKVYDYFYDQIYYFAVKIMSDRATAEDIVIETFVKLWLRRNYFENSDNIKAFLYITTKNACLDQLKKNSRQQKRIDTFSQLQETEYRIEEAGIQAELLSLIFHESKKLPGKCRQIFNLSFREGLKNDEIAEKLKISPHTIRTQQRRAILALRTFLAVKGLPFLVIVSSWFC